MRRGMLVVVAVSIVLGACATKKPKVGDYCKSEDEDTMVCAGAATALLCHASRRVELACRGPKGCAGTDHATCDRSLGREGDPCGSQDVDIMCTEDKGATLLCKNGKLTVDLRCRGPKACDPTTNDCDRSIGEVGDTCDVQRWYKDMRGACTADGKASLRCDKDAGKLFMSWYCGGPKGCQSGKLESSCDRGNFAAGAPCGKNDWGECIDTS